MKRAQKIPRYSDMKGFSAPSGVVNVQVDKVTNRLATPACPQFYNVAFIAGTEPTETCEQSFSDHRGVFSKILGLGSPPAAPPPATTNGPVQVAPGSPGSTSEAAQTGANGAPDQKKKKGFFSRVFGGKAETKDQKDPNTTPTQNPGNKPPPN